MKEWKLVDERVARRATLLNPLKDIPLPPADRSANLERLGQVSLGLQSPNSPRRDIQASRYLVCRHHQGSGSERFGGDPFQGFLAIRIF